MASVSDVAWLEKVVDPYYRDMPGITQRPFSMVAGGTTWACATNGKILVALDIGLEPPAPLAPLESENRYVREFLERSLDGGIEIDLAEFRAWIGSDPAPCPPTPCSQCKDRHVVMCPKCHGRGTVDCTCPTCDDFHDADCGTCEDGKVPCPACTKIPDKIIAGWVGSVCLDRRYFFRVLPHLSGDRARLIIDQSIRGATLVILAGASWRLLLMPLRPEGFEDATRFPLREVA